MTPLEFDYSNPGQKLPDSPLASFQNLGSRRMVADCLEELATVFAATGRPEPALRLAGAAMTVREQIGAGLSSPERAALEQRLLPARQMLSDAAAEEAWQAGRRLRPRDAVAEAMQDEPISVGTGKPADALTAREHEVLALISRGFSNRQIANELVISGGTAHRHVANILSKLGLHSRSQIAVWAVEHGLGLRR
jgi:DNA-binding NarL/FixJ family response regulator